MSEQASDQASLICKKCGQRPRSLTRQPGGAVVLHLYCGGSDCSVTPSTTEQPISSIPTPAAVGHSDSISIRPEDLRDPVAKTISLNMKNRWSSDDAQLKNIKGVYRLDLPAKIYRRFDMALQMNDGCPVITTYYGGRETCGITKDSVTRAHPCVMESCALCTAVRSAFGNFLYGNSSHDGTYGPGVYTYVNPASAHQALAPTLQGQDKNYAIIQCRVVSQGKERKSENSYAGFVDESGTVFCAQPVAIIPTHLLTYSVVGKKWNSRKKPDAGSSQAQSATTQGAPNPLSIEAVITSGAVSNSNIRGNRRVVRELPDRSESLGSQRDEDGYLHSLSLEDPDDDGDNLPSVSSSLTPQPGSAVEALRFYSESQDFYELSNYAPYPVTYRGKVYPTAEHLFQASKFLDHRPLLAEHIRRGSDRPKFAYIEGRRLVPETRPDWKEKSIRIMNGILYLKFTQHSALWPLLLSTGDKVLVFNAGKDDDFWGNGASGAGRNELGKALMRLRTKLRNRANAAF